MPILESSGVSLKQMGSHSRWWGHNPFWDLALTGERCQHKWGEAGGPGEKSLCQENWVILGNLRGQYHKEMSAVQISRPFYILSMKRIKNWNECKQIKNRNVNWPRIKANFILSTCDSSSGHRHRGPPWLDISLYHVLEQTASYTLETGAPLWHSGTVHLQTRKWGVREEHWLL